MIYRGSVVGHIVGRIRLSVVVGGSVYCIGIGRSVYYYCNSTSPSDAATSTTTTTTTVSDTASTTASDAASDAATITTTTASDAATTINVYYCI